MLKENLFKEWLKEVIEIAADEEDIYIDIKDFEEAGILTSDEGLVVKLEDGSELQLTIKQSK